jgi:hypothetical protein
MKSFIQWPTSSFTKKETIPWKYLVCKTKDAQYLNSPLLLLYRLYKVFSPLRTPIAELADNVKKGGKILPFKSEHNAYPKYK